MVDSSMIFATLRMAQWQFDLAYRISPKSTQKYGECVCVCVCARLHVLSYVKCDCHYAIVTHLTFAGKLSANNFCTRLNENPSHCLVACTGLQTDGRSPYHVVFIFTP